MTRRAVVLVAAALVVLATTAGTSAFSAATIDRGLAVSVVDDDSAYLGVTLEQTDTTNGTTNLTVTVRNQFPGDSTLSNVTVTANGAAETVTSLQSGEEATITFENATCDSTVTIEATGGGVDVALERTIDC
jgi:subtilase family serine protease